MQEGSAPKRAAVGQRRRPIRGVEDQLNIAVGDGVYDVRPAFQHLVDLFGRHAVVAQKARRPGRRQHLEAEREQKLHRIEDARLVAFAHRDEYRPSAWYPRATAKLAL